MDIELRNKLIERARENGAKFGKKAELDFGAGAEWMYEQLLQNHSTPTPDERGEGLVCYCGRNHESKEIRNNKCDLCGKDLTTPH